ncbi:MAG TPA: thioredoxin domain-containing protein [Pyrinomonadaceae bacterium]|jgi:protein-disulfide isomerase
MQKLRPFLIIAAVLAVTIVGSMLWLRSIRRQAVFTNGPAASSLAQAEPGIPAQTVVTVEEFGDYQCPRCGELHPALKQLKQNQSATMNLVFRNLPLTTIHKNSLVAAQAAEAARMQNRFWEMHDLLYENQQLWGDDINPKTIFMNWASDLGLDTARFAADMDGKQVKMRIEADQEAAAELGINGTPTVLVNGRQLLPEATTAEGIRTAIEYVTKGKKN